MKIELITYTPDFETLIATAMLTTTSGSKPSDIFRRLSRNPARVDRLLGRLEVQHGSILEHNRLCWAVDAVEGEVLDILLRNRFFSFTRLNGSKWLLSSNLRAAIGYIHENRDHFADALLDSIREAAPAIADDIEGMKA